MSVCFAVLPPCAAAEASQQQPALQAQHHAALEKAIREHCGKKLSAFKVWLKGVLKMLYSCQGACV